jgi:DNA-directed RNA polymerase subunit RPC12/RpoP
MSRPALVSFVCGSCGDELDVELVADISLAIEPSHECLDGTVFVGETPTERRPPTETLEIKIEPEQGDDDFPPACIECGSSDTGLVGGHPHDAPAVKCNECGVVFE